ncbi:hypothetical protein N5K37_29815 [Delftia tsuruhatensis]|jgi:hypothetical protein|uniref:hypothetical protein n=1 Tax=Delftia TaxID=80865 RepID=UPI000613F575|nr:MULTISPECIES: hypothetical protein [Delftia]MDH2234118.1 hypothetical protein [Delftia tsuruhatensis]
MQENSALTVQHFDGEREAQTIARFQSLQAGQYWRALEGIPQEGISAGAVLLVLSVRLVDDKPHTIILRPHPLQFGTGRTLRWRDKTGQAQQAWHGFKEHRFLLLDFLRLFEFEPDHEAVRAKEVAQIQTNMARLQAEMVEAQADPGRMNAIVEAGLREARAKTLGHTPRLRDQDQDEDSEECVAGAAVPQRPSRSTDLAFPVSQPPVDPSIAAIATGTLSEALETGITDQKIGALRTAAQQELQIATIKASWIQGKAGEISSELAKLTPFFDEKAQAALAHTEEVRNYVGELLDGIGSLNLYVGEDVVVQTICEGASAPRSEPLTFVQAKKLMDEELAVFEDLDQRFDFESEARFFDALRAHPALIEQVFPTQRCVLVMCVSRRHIDYGDTWTNTVRNEENAKVFMLVRNGQNIHRVFSPVESHLGSARLFPTKADDQSMFFRGIDGNKIRFEDVAYSDALNAHEKHALHYKRFLILAAGLDHRLKLFGDFHDEGESLAFVSQRFQDRWCRFLHDDDAGSMLDGGVARPSYQSWIDSKNAYLRPGSRVLCQWRDLINPDTASGITKRTYQDHGRGFTMTANALSPMECVVAYKDGCDVCVDVHVQIDSYRSDRQFNAKVRVSKFRPNYWDHEEMPYLVLDAVEPEDLRWYIHHRNTRVNHLSYIRFFKQALKLVEAERAAEEPARQALLQALNDGCVGPEHERPALVHRAVIAWRAAHRGKPLPHPQQKATAEWRRLLDQMFSLSREGMGLVAQVQEFAERQGYAPLRLVLSGKSKHVLYAAPQEDECDNRLMPHAWVHRITLTHTKTRFTEVSRKWALLPSKAASETTQHEWPGAQEWVRDSNFSSFERKQEIMGLCERFEQSVAPFLSTPDTATFGQMAADYLAALRDSLDTSKTSVVLPVLAFPIALVSHKNTGEMGYLCIANRRAYRVLASLVPDDDFCAGYIREIKRQMSRSFADQEKFQSLWNRARDIRSDWQLIELDVSAFSGESPYIKAQAIKSVSQAARPPLSALMADWYEKWHKDASRFCRIWHPEAHIDANGKLLIDAMLGIEQPQGYCPVHARLVTYSSHSRDGGVAAPRYARWLDVAPIDAELPECPRPEIGIGMSSSTSEYLNRAEAIAAMTQTETSRGSMLVPSHERPDAPQPPQGVERLLIIPCDEAL